MQVSLCLYGLFRCVCVRACVVYAGEEVKGGEWNKSLFVFLQY